MHNDFVWIGENQGLLIAHNLDKATPSTDRQMENGRLSAHSLHLTPPEVGTSAQNRYTDCMIKTNENR